LSTSPDPVMNASPVELFVIIVKKHRFSVRNCLLKALFNSPLSCCSNPSLISHNHITHTYYTSSVIHRCSANSFIPWR
jgi:hypothetical protein